MKLTKTKLKQLIKEELDGALYETETGELTPEMVYEKLQRVEYRLSYMLDMVIQALSEPGIIDIAYPTELRKSVTGGDFGPDSW
jgi:hypothetical protein